MFKSSSHLAGAAFALAMLASAMPGLAEDKVLAKVNGQPITDRDLGTLMTNMSQQLAQVPEGARKRAALDRLIDMRILAGEAGKQGLDKSPDFTARLESVRQQLLITEFVKLKVEAAVTDDMVKARYDKEAAGFTPPEELRARHVLVKTKEEAEAVIKELNAGADFAKLATDKSTDPGSAKEGGDLGYFATGDMVAPFEEAAQKLKIGDYTKEPVQTQFGFHVIKLEDRRKQPVPPFDQVKDQIKQTVIGERFAEILGEIKKGTKIDIDEAALTAK